MWQGLVKSSARLPEQRGRRSPGRGGLKTTSESSVWSFACREQTPRGAGLTRETGCGRWAGLVARDGAGRPGLRGRRCPGRLSLRPAPACLVSGKTPPPNLRSLEVGGSRETRERAKPVEAPESAGAEVAFELPTRNWAGILPSDPCCVPKAFYCPLLCPEWGARALRLKKCPRNLVKPRAFRGHDDSPSLQEAAA